MAAAEATTPSLTSSQVAPEQYVLAGGTTPLNAEAAAFWEQALAKARGQLASLLSDPNREALFADVFGHAGTDAATFAANLQKLIANLGGDGLQIAVDLRSDSELAGAFAAYAASGHTGSERIYVNADKLNNGLLDVNLATSALLEEFGHALDTRLNGGVDSPGDEGQLFAAEVSGMVLTAEQRAVIDAEDDSAVLTIEGVQVGVEQASISTVTIPSGGTDNTFKTGDNVDITVSFSETVLVTGTPNLAINVGGVNKTASYQSGSNSSTLTFRYTVAANDTDANGISITAGSINLNTGTIKDLAGNAATLSYSAVADQSNALVDTTAPTLTGQFPASNAIGVDRGTSIILTFSENIRANGGTVGSSVTIQSGSSTYSTITLVGGITSTSFISPHSAPFASGRWFINGNKLIIDNTGTILPSNTANINVDISNAAIADLAGNAYAGISSNSSGIFFATANAPTSDTSAPTISPVTYGTNDGSLAVGESVTFSIDFSEVVSVRGTPTLTLSNSATAVYTSGDLSNTLVYTYTVGAGDTATADLALAATPWGTFTTASATAITDLAGNVLWATAGANINPTNILAVDTTAPTISSVAITSATGAQNSTLNAGDVVTATVTMNEAVTVTGTPQLALNIGGTTVQASYASGTGTSSLVFTYTILAGQTDANGISIAANSLTLNGGTIRDLAGNTATITNTAVTDNASYFVDTTAPTSNVGSQSAPLVEAGGASNATAGTAAATITVTKADALSSASFDSADFTNNGWSSADAGATYTKVGSYGTATFTIASGVVSYSLNNSAAATQALTQGQAAADGFGTLRIVDAAGNSSQTAAISFAITGANDFPTFSVLTPPVETTGRNSQKEISFAELLAQANATDEDGTVVAFQVAAVASGSLLIGSSAGTATAWAAGSNDRVNAGTNLYWTPAAGQAGTLANPLATGAFSVYAVDNNGGLSAYPVTATVNVVCFLAGTLIATPTGEQPIETLQPGDLISTAEGPQPVRFLARSTRSIAQLQALGKMPIRINQGALGSLGPAQDSFLSPSHAIHFAGCLVEAGALINGTSIQQLDDWPEAALTYYNIELERHGLITANGLLAESYFANYRSNGFSRDCWDNYHDYVALYGAGELMEELPLPRIAFARQIPMQLRLSLQLHEDNFKAANPGIAESKVDQFAGLCL